MHLAEGLLPAPHAVALTVAALPFVILGAKRSLSIGVHRAGMATALLFAVTLFPVPVPIVGMSSHMCAVPVLALLLGAWQLVLPTALVLLMQALFFAHGGVTTLGANLLTLGVAGPFAAVGLARMLRWLRVPWAPSVFVACAVADLVVYALDAVILASALTPWRQMWPTVWRLMLALSPAQIPLALLEGALSVALLRALWQRDKGRIPVWLHPSKSSGGLGAPVAAALTFLACLGVSPPAFAAAFEGLDDRVFVAAAQAAGRHVQPLLDLEGSELGRSLFGGAMLAVGFVLGRWWWRLGKPV